MAAEAGGSGRRPAERGAERISGALEAQGLAGKNMIFIQNDVLYNYNNNNNNNRI